MLPLLSHSYLERFKYKSLFLLGSAFEVKNFISIILFKSVCAGFTMIIDENFFNKIVGIVVVAILGVLTFLILEPILISTIFALILSFIFYPMHKRIVSKVKSKNLSAFITCLILLVIIILPLFFFIPLILKQAFQIYTFLQGENFLAPIYDWISRFSSSPDLSKNLIIGLNSFVGKITSSFFSRLTEIALSSPTILLHLLIVLFVFFFGLRDGEEFVAYIQSISPLSKESEKKVFQQFKDVTYSVIYGNIIVGIIHGLAAGIALFILGIPNAMVLTLLAIFFSIIPLLGPWLVWVPVDIYLFTVGRTTAAFSLLIYGLIAISWIDNIIRPLIVSRRTKINSAVVLVSMIGGLLVFGVLGLILGPLIISYLILLIETFRNKKADSILVQKVDSKV
jgi:predicted PurR-regulated permease PerM